MINADEEHARLKQEIIIRMCIECADDLGRWVRAFTAQDESLLATLLEGLQHHFIQRVRGDHPTVSSLLPELGIIRQIVREDHDKP